VNSAVLIVCRSYRLFLPGMPILRGPFKIDGREEEFCDRVNRLYLLQLLASRTGVCLIPAGGTLQKRSSEAAPVMTPLSISIFCLLPRSMIESASVPWFVDVAVRIPNQYRCKAAKKHYVGVFAASLGRSSRSAWCDRHKR